MIRIWCLFFILCFSSMRAGAAQLNYITSTQQENKTTLYFTIDGSFTHHLFILSNPDRVILDLSSTRLGLNIKQLHLVGPFIKQVRTGQPDPTTLRLVFDVPQKVQATSAPWRPQNAMNGIKVDLQAPGSLVMVNKTAPHLVLPATNSIPHTEISIPKKPDNPAPTRIIHPVPVRMSHSPSLSHRDVVIVLDAGHGGKDPGARGPRQSREKDVVLAITLKLKQLIDRQPGMRAVLTRKGDYYVGLRNRLDIARKYNGDVFVSIHADAFNNPHSNGASVFALSQSGATSEAARWIAEKENYSELGGVNLGDLDDRNGVVRSVLIDLSQTATINSGLQMGGRVLNQLHNFTSLHNNKVEQARFMVLKSPDIPSILVETGFISNPREEKNLTSSSYQIRLSQAIFQGIKYYFWESPPHGTRIEAMTAGRYHIVRSGETLPSIATHYHVPVSSLQTMNNLWGNRTLSPGQKLTIPSAWA